MTSILSNNGFWFAVGIIVGLAIEFVGTWFFDRWWRPQLSVSLEGLWPVTTTVTIPTQPFTVTDPKLLRTLNWELTGRAELPMRPLRITGQGVTVTAFRFRVNNDGRRAADNVAGTLEFENTERRICWYEGNVPTIKINAHDHSYLDVYGVVLDPENNPTNDIVMPTEHGWDNLPTRTLTAPLPVHLRVTASNAQRATTDFSIDPARGCRPVNR